MAVIDAGSRARRGIPRTHLPLPAQITAGMGVQRTPARVLAVMLAVDAAEGSCASERVDGAQSLRGQVKQGTREGEYLNR